MLLVRHLPPALGRACFIPRESRVSSVDWMPGGHRRGGRHLYGCHDVGLTPSKVFNYVKAKFATGADSWLVAYARIHGAIVVTNEQSALESKREVKLPDVYDQFEVPHNNIFAMLRVLNIRSD